MNLGVYTNYSIHSSITNDRLSRAGFIFFSDLYSAVRVII